MVREAERIMWEIEEDKVQVMFDEKENGNKENGSKAFEELLEWHNACMNRLNIEIELMDMKKEINLDKNNLFDREGILAEDDVIYLKKISATEYEGYQELLREDPDYKKKVKEYPQYMSGLWKDYKDKKKLTCSIMRKEDAAYLGYCGIKNLCADTWEVSIELLKRHISCGYGYRALSLFLDTLKRKTGVTVYRSRVKGNNYICQGLMEKIGALLNGISSFYPCNIPEVQKRMEEEYGNLIDDRAIEIAKKFGVEPKKLLSHVLEYKIMR